MEKDTKLTTHAQPFMTPGSEIAIIGFWKREESEDLSKEWKCYFYYNVPNPIKREIRRSERDRG